MAVPIRYCLGWPERLGSAFEPFDPVRWRTLSFEPLDEARFPAVGLAYEALRAGGDAGARLNAADEVATAAFLAGTLPFPAVTATAARVLAARPARPIRSLQDVLAADAEARDLARELVAAHTATPTPPVS
jgi:1-deoxy-D-xylulose-5-phosphate reductoisomerase